MKVVHICTDIARGGAAQAALNLHLGLRHLGIESTVLSLSEPEGLPYCEDYFNLKSGNRAIKEARSILLKEISRVLAWKNRTKISNTHFSIDLFGCKLSNHPLVQEADVINLHWTAEFLSSISVAELATLDKPLVWTLHDMRPLTGGCHFPAGCDRFMETCGKCPQLLEEPLGYTARTLQAMSSAIAAARTVFIAPSRWMLQNVRKSFAARRSVSYHIPYGVDSDVFKPLEKPVCRSRLKIKEDVWYVLVTMHGFREFRKGVDDALAVLDRIRRDPVGGQAVARGRMRVLCCGADVKHFKPVGWRVERCEGIEAGGMPLVYNSANVLLFTSLEDNLPNVLLEAMACGVPVISHRVGGTPDILNDEPNCLFDIGNMEAAANFIINLFQNDDPGLCSRFAAKIRQNYSIKKQASEYLKLYINLIAEFQAVPTLFASTPLREGADEALFLAMAKKETPTWPASLVSFRSRRCKQSLF